MKQATFDPKRIRKCELVTGGDKPLVQFIATGDKHKMIRNDDGKIEVIKLPEQGRDYRYGDPYELNDAVSLLEEGHYEGHLHIAEQLKNYLAQMQ